MEAPILRRRNGRMGGVGLATARRSTAVHLRARALAVTLAAHVHHIPSSTGKRGQHVDRVARLQRLGPVPHGYAIAEKRASRQDPRQCAMAAPEPVHKIADRSAGMHGQLLGIHPCGGAGGREIPHSDVAGVARLASPQPPIAFIGRAGWTKLGSLMPWPAGLPHIAARQAASIAVSSAPLRSSTRKSVSSVAKRQLRI